MGIVFHNYFVISTVLLCIPINVIFIVMQNTLNIKSFAITTKFQISIL